MRKSIIISLFLTMLCSCDGDDPTIREFGNGYFLAFNSMNDYAVAKPSKGHPKNEIFEFVIYGDIVSYDFDSLYLIAAEKPRDSIPEIITLPSDEGDRIFKESNFRQYYILNKRTDQLYGPYKKRSFEAKRKELKVSEELNINKNRL